jgi:transcriptional regulator with XRE-family HTH domain
MGVFEERVGVALRRARRARALTLRAVAKLSDDRFRPTSIAGYERGERSISLERFCELCRLYDVDPATLLTEILETAVAPPEVGLDVERPEALDPPEAALVAGFVREVRTLRHGRSSDAIVLRAGDVEVLATAAGKLPEELVGLLSRHRRSAEDGDPAPEDRTRRGT